MTQGSKIDQRMLPRESEAAQRSAPSHQRKPGIWSHFTPLSDSFGDMTVLGASLDPELTWGVMRGGSAPAHPQHPLPSTSAAAQHKPGKPRKLWQVKW